MLTHNHNIMVHPVYAKPQESTTQHLISARLLVLSRVGRSPVLSLVARTLGCPLRHEALLLLTNPPCLLKPTVSSILRLRHIFRPGFVWPAGGNRHHASRSHSTTGSAVCFHPLHLSHSCLPEGDSDLTPWLVNQAEDIEEYDKFPELYDERKYSQPYVSTPISICLWCISDTVIAAPSLKVPGSPPRVASRSVPPSPSIR